MLETTACPKCGRLNPAISSKILDLDTGKPVGNAFMGYLAFILGVGFAAAGGWYTVTLLATPGTIGMVSRSGSNPFLPIAFFFFIAFALSGWGGKIINQRRKGNNARYYSLRCRGCNYAWQGWEPGAKVHEGIQQDWQIRLLQTAQGRERIQAIYTLGETGDEKAVGPLIEVLKDRSLAKVNDRVAAIRSLQALSEVASDDRIVEAICGALNDNIQVQQVAIGVLGEMGDRRAVEPLIHVLSVKDVAIRVQVALALGNIGDPAAIETLTQLSQDKHSSVREAAQEALEMIRERISSEAAASGERATEGEKVVE